MKIRRGGRCHGIGREIFMKSPGACLLIPQVDRIGMLLNNTTPDKSGWSETSV